MDTNSPPDNTAGDPSTTRRRLTEEQAEFATILGRLLAGLWSRLQHSAQEHPAGANSVDGPDSDPSA